MGIEKVNPENLLKLKGSLEIEILPSVCIQNTSYIRPQGKSIQTCSDIKKIQKSRFDPNCNCGAGCFTSNDLDKLYINENGGENLHATNNIGRYLADIQFVNTQKGGYNGFEVTLIACDGGIDRSAEFGNSEIFVSSLDSYTSLKVVTTGYFVLEDSGIF